MSLSSGVIATTLHIKVNIITVGNYVFSSVNLKLI
jgi:hypothetical protein